MADQMLSKGPPSKRHRDEDSRELNELNRSMGTLLCELKEKDDKSIDDIFSLLCSFMEYTIKKDQKDLIIDAKIEEIEEKVGFLDIKQENMVTKQNDFQAQINTIEKSINMMDQKKIDNDVYISLFTTKPNVEKVVKEILKLSKSPENSLKDFYTIPIKQNHAANSTQLPSSSSIFYGIVASFKNFNDKISFLKARRKLGPIKLNQLLSHLPREDDRSIKIQNRLSAFNLKALKTLNGLKNTKKISDFRMHNGLFKYQLTDDTRWQILSSNEQLNKMLESPNDMSI